MRVNSAGLAKPVLRSLGPKAVQRQVVLTFQDMHGVGECRYRRRTAPAAKTAVASVMGCDPMGQGGLDQNGTAVAAGPYRLCFVAHLRGTLGMFDRTSRYSGCG